MVLQVRTQDDGEPTSFRLGRNDYKVIAVSDRWFGSGTTFHKVEASDGNIYILRRDDVSEVWTLESFRAQVNFS